MATVAQNANAVRTNSNFIGSGGCEELRVVCGTRGVPGTVAPFRAWRGSRDLVAQSPKLHAPAVVQHDCRFSV